MSPIELIAVVVTVVAVYLTTRQVVWCWPIGMVSVALYAKVFFDAKLYADMGLQGLYFALAAYGWWAWQHGGADDGELEVTVLGGRARASIAIAAAGFGIGLGLLLSRTTDASLPFMDSLLASFSIAAQWLQTRKRLEAWILWLAVDVFYVGMFLYKSLYLTAGLYTVFLYLAALGLVSWRRSMADAAGRS